jgi:hypothetical protein
MGAVRVELLLHSDGFLVPLQQGQRINRLGSRNSVLYVSKDHAIATQIPLLQHHDLHGYFVLLAK